MSDTKGAADGFLSRWSRRKVQVREAALPPAEVPAEPATARAEVSKGPTEPSPASIPQPERAIASVQAPAPNPPPPPTLDDVAQLEIGSDFTRFVAPDVTPEVKNAAMKRLFADPHFNVMDGLDTYIDDYGKPDPIPLSMLRQMVQSRALGLFADAAEAAADTPVARAAPDGAVATHAAQSATELPAPIADDQDAALRLQPLDAAGPPGTDGGAEPHAGRER